MKALVQAGANVNAQTNGGKTPIHLAKSIGFGAVADFLMAHGVILPKPPPISSKLAAADVANGKALFNGHCAHCHPIEPQVGENRGHNLWEIVGRDKASSGPIPFSETLQAWDGEWSYEDLNIFLLGPMLTTPGVYMETAGIADVTERAGLIAYLRTLSDKLPPLP